ncbi:MAG: hypothetical protein KGI25_05460 [Thaumarchaeota archaeon]|nr:hypothetical protein [Nitrososphaerota archaeon]
MTITSCSHNLSTREKGMMKFSHDDYDLPKRRRYLPKYFARWTRVAHPLVNGKKRKLERLPMWKSIYEDESSFITIVGGRQLVCSAQKNGSCRAVIESTGNIWMSIHDALEETA